MPFDKLFSYSVHVAKSIALLCHVAMCIGTVPCYVYIYTVSCDNQEFVKQRWCYGCVVASTGILGGVRPCFVCYILAARGLE